MRSGIIVSVFIWLATAGGLPQAASASGEGLSGTQLDAFVASVNDRILTFGDVLMLSQEEERNLRMKASGSELESKLCDLYRRVREELISRALILEDAKRTEAAIDERMIDDYMSQTVRSQFANDRTAFLDALSHERLTVEDYRRRIADDLLIMLLRRQEVSDRTLIAPRDVLRAYESRRESYRHPEQVKLRALLLQRGATPLEQSTKKIQAEKLVERLSAGEDFSVLAREFSEGPGAAAGGEWDWLNTVDVVPALREEVSRLEVGKPSGVVETDEWFFILRLDARRPEKITPFEEVRYDLEKELRRAEEERIYRRWMVSLEARHYVRRMAEPWVDSP